MDVVFSIRIKITVLHQGQVLAEGTPAEVRDNSRSATGVPGRNRIILEVHSRILDGPSQILLVSPWKCTNANAWRSSAAMASAKPPRCAVSWG